MIQLLAALAAATPCTTTCAPPPDRGDGTLDIASLLERVAEAPAGAPSVALDTLLFQAGPTVDWLDHHGAGPLSEEQAAWLGRELARDMARVELRLVEADGAVRGTLDDAVPLSDKLHLRLLDTGSLGRITLNGHVERVGPEHLWARL